MTRAETVEYAIKFFNRRLREPVLQYGERQALHIAISALREQGGSFQNGNDHNTVKDWPPYMDLPRERDVTEINVGSKWISVEERLPEAEQEVRVLCKASWNSCYRYQCQAFYEPKGMLREKSDYGWDYECCSEYSEEDDDYFVNPGWYERIHNWDDYSAVGIADEVTHWMPLPELPKEG